MHNILRFIPLVFLCLMLAGCATGIKPPRDASSSKLVLEATGYCKCKKCCGWKRNWLLRPVVASGPSEGKKKKIGQTASGTKAEPGTIAADTNRFPFGTVMYIPGYGYGRVEDRGGAIKGNKIDLFFKTHKQALQWGRRQVETEVWVPRSKVGSLR